MEIPKHIKTVREIKETLDGPNNSKGHWGLLPNMFGVPQVSAPERAGGKINFLEGKAGIVLVGFINNDNAEVRFFLAKYTDIKERDYLFE